MGRFIRTALAAALLGTALPCLAVQPVFNPAGGSFYDMPWPFELRRDADGTVALANFPFGANAIVQSFAVALEEVPGFGLNSGVFVKLDGDLDESSLPADAAASIAPDASVFLIDIDRRSRRRGQRIPIWTEFRSAGDAYRDAHLLGAMPVPGHVLDPGTLYALVVTKSVLGDDLEPLSAPPLITRMAAETPSGAFEQAALPLFRQLWRQLEQHEGISRGDVACATIYRTATPADGLVRTEKLIARQYKDVISNVVYHSDGGTYWVLRGNIRLPQFQTGTPPFTPTTGKFTFDSRGRPIVLREDTVEFLLSIPKEHDDGSLRMPRSGWPIVHYMHGTGGSRFSFLGENIAGRLAQAGIAVLAIDQPLHGMRPGATPDGNNFYNPTNPFALRDNPRQAAADSLTVHQAAARLKLPAALIPAPAGPGYVLPRKPIKFRRTHRMVMGHSQGGTTLPLFLGVVRQVRGGMLSAGGGHIILNVLTREQPFFAGLKLRDLVELLLGMPVDLFHPALHLLQMGTEVSEPLVYARRFGVERRRGPLNVLFTHGMLDAYVTTPMTLSMVAAGGYPLISPTFPPIAFPLLPSYDYQETFDLAGLPTLPPPVAGNLGSGRKTATGGALLYELDGHFPVFNNPTTQAQFTEFLRSLAYEDQGVIAAP